MGCEFRLPGVLLLYLPSHLGGCNVMYQGNLAVRTEELGQRQNASEDRAARENLALLYQGLLTGIVGLQSERQHIPDGESFRKRTKATLQEIELVAASAGYDVPDVKDTHFA